MEFLSADKFKTLTNPGVTSIQLLSPHNSLSERITITRVTVQVNAKQPRHSHATSEQIWIAVSGFGTLLLADDKTLPFMAGDVVRFADGDAHGFVNSGSEPFVYISVTSPPINFSFAYADGK